MPVLLNIAATKACPLRGGAECGDAEAIEYRSRARVDYISRQVLDPQPSSKVGQCLGIAHISSLHLRTFMLPRHRTDADGATPRLLNFAPAAASPWKR